MPLQAVQQFSRGNLRSAVTQEHGVETMPAPIGGLNTSLPFISQQPTDCVACENFIVRPIGLETREGFLIWQNELEFPVRTLMEFHDRDSTNDKLFSVTKEGIYNTTLRLNNPVKPTPDVLFAFQEEFKSDIWSHTNFSAGAVSFLCCCSAGNGYWTYDSAGGWVQRIGGVGTGQIDGTDPLQFDFVMEWKRRLWFFKDGETKAWYLPVLQVAGEVREFDFGPFLTHGGSLAALFSWTRDGGDGADDFLVIAGTQGDVVVYQGTDPNQAVSFALAGSWFVGQFPVGRRFFASVGGDVYMLSSEGLLSLEVLMRGKTVDDASALSFKINESLTKEFELRKDELSWEIVYYSREELMIVKIPSRINEINWAFAVNLNSKGWSTFTDVPMETLGILNNELYGSDNKGDLFKVLSGEYDNVGFDNQPAKFVTAQMQTSFVPIQGGNNLKIPHLAAVVFLASVAPSVTVKANTEFDFSPIAPAPFQPSDLGSLWDQSNWDEAVWVGSSNSYESVYGLDGLGHFISLRMSVRGKARTTFTHWRLTYKMGGSM